MRQAFGVYLSTTPIVRRRKLRCRAVAVGSGSVFFSVFRNRGEMEEIDAIPSKIRNGIKVVGATYVGTEETGNKDGWKWRDWYRCKIAGRTPQQMQEKLRYHSINDGPYHNCGRVAVQGTGGSSGDGKVVFRKLTSYRKAMTRATVAANKIPWGEFGFPVTMGVGGSMVLLDWASIIQNGTVSPKLTYLGDRIPGEWFASPFLWSLLEQSYGEVIPRTLDWINSMLDNGDCSADWSKARNAFLDWCVNKATRIMSAIRKRSKGE